MRRRVVCPRNHPASLYLRRLSSRLRYGSRCFSGGIPPGPPVALTSASCVSTRARATPRLCPRDRLPTAIAGRPRPPARRASRGTCCGRCGTPAARPSPGAKGSSEASAGVRQGFCGAIFAGCWALLPHLRFEDGSGAASSLRNRRGCRIFVSCLLWPPPRASAAHGGRSRHGAGPVAPALVRHASRRATSTPRSPVVHFAHTHMTLRLLRAAIAAERLPCVARKAILARWYTTGSRRGCEPGSNAPPVHIPSRPFLRRKHEACSVWPNPNLNENLTTPAY